VIVGCGTGNGVRASANAEQTDAQASRPNSPSARATMIPADDGVIAPFNLTTYSLEEGGVALAAFQMQAEPANRYTKRDDSDGQIYTGTASFRASSNPVHGRSIVESGVRYPLSREEWWALFLQTWHASCNNLPSPIFRGSSK
jgi:hypothetical protein